MLRPKILELKMALSGLERAAIQSPWKIEISKFGDVGVNRNVRGIYPKSVLRLRGVWDYRHTSLRSQSI